MADIFTVSEAGGRPGIKLSNEDFYLVQPHPDDPELIFCAVADGQGGRAGGACASEVACTAAFAAFGTFAPWRLAWERPWNQILQAADLAVKQEPQAGMTTLAMLCLRPQQLIGISVGDSAVSLYNTADLQPDRLTAKQRANPPIGSGQAVGELFRSSLPTVYRLLLMTDGVWKYTGWDPIDKAVQGFQGDALLAHLQQEARPYGRGPFKDDFTLVLIERDKLS